MHQARFGRVGLRRLSNLEFENTIHHFFSITTPIQDLLPGGNLALLSGEGGGQQISPAHIRGYLVAAERTISSTLDLERSHLPGKVITDYAHSPCMKIWYDRRYADGGDHTKPLEDAVVAFKRTDFIWRTDRNGFKVGLPGLYRVTADIKIQPDCGCTPSVLDSDGLQYRNRL